MTDELIAALKESCGFEVVTLDSADGRLRIAGRVPQDASRWKAVKDRLLIAADDGRLSAVDVSQWHFRRTTGGEKRTVYLWRIITKDDPATVAEVIRSRAPVRYEEPREGIAKLQISDSRAGILPNGKGAFPIKPVV